MSAVPVRVQATLVPTTCGQCASALSADGTCLWCTTAGKGALTSNRRGKSVYTHKGVSAMLDALLADGGVMRGVDEEIAALVTQANRLMLAVESPETALIEGVVMSEKDRVSELRKTIDSVVSAKNRRQEMLEREGYYVSFAVFQGFLAEVGRALRKHVRDEHVLRAIGEELGDLQLRYRDAARSAT